MAKIFRIVLVGIVLYWLIYDIYADDSRTYNRNADLNRENCHSQKSKKQPIQENSKKKKSETKRANNKDENISEIDNPRKISSDLQRLFRKILHLMELFDFTDSNLKHTRTQNNEYIPTVDGTEPEKKSGRSGRKSENQADHADDKSFDENEESASKSEEKRDEKLFHLKEDEDDNGYTSSQEDGEDYKDSVSYQEDEDGNEVPYKDEDVNEDKSYREDENDNEDECNQEENDDEDESNQEEGDNDEAPYQEDEDDDEDESYQEDEADDEDESYQEDENEDDSNQEENDNNEAPYQDEEDKDITPDEDDNEGKSFQEDEDNEHKSYQEDENDNEELSYQDEHERENKSHQDDDKLASPNQEDKQNIDKNNRGSSSNKKNERSLKESAKESSKTFDNSFSVNTTVGMEKHKLENPKIIPPQNKNGETSEPTIPSAENEDHSKNIDRRTSEDLRRKSLNILDENTDNNKSDVVNIDKTSTNSLPLRLPLPNQTDEMEYKDFGIRGSFGKNEADNEAGTNQKRNQRLLYETNPLKYTSLKKPSSDLSRTSRFQEVGELSKAIEISENKEAPFEAGSTLQTETQDSTKFKTLLEYIYSLTNNSFFMGLKDEREEIEKY